MDKAQASTFQVLKAVAPLQAPTDIPKVRAGRPLGVPPFAFDGNSTFGSPEVPSSGDSGAAPPSAGAPEGGAPTLDTYGSSASGVPSRAAIFRPLFLSLAEYRRRLADELKSLARFYFPKGKNRRGFQRKALAVQLCGKVARVQKCSACGAMDPATALIESSCDLRTCPTCARRRANVLRERLDTSYAGGPHPRDMGLYLLTFTLRYDPSDPNDLSVEGLRRRKKIVRDAVGFVWKKYLKPRGRALALGLETSPRGAVHIHALYHGRRPDVGKLRETYMFAAGDSPFVNCKYVRKPAKAIRELAKYVVKAASPKNPRLLRGGRGEFIDPVLAARTEVAFSGARLYETFGAWRGANDEKDLPEQAPRDCPCCGASEWTQETLTLRSLISMLPDDWTPRFGRAGPQSKKQNQIAQAKGEAHAE